MHSTLSVSPVYSMFSKSSRCALLVDHRVMVCEPVDYGIHKKASLVVDKFDGEIKPAPYVLV